MIRTNNYEIAKRQAAKLFLQCDQARMIRKFDLRHDADWLYLPFFSRDFRISRATGRADYRRAPWESGEAWAEADFNAALTLYDLLGNAREDCRPAGTFATVANLDGMGAVASQPSSGDFYGPTSALFDRNPELLRRACLAMGGTEEGKGDVAFRLPVFSFMDMRVQFWQSDDEFPPQLTFLWDKNMLMYLRYETVWYAAGYLADQLEACIRAHDPV